MSELSPQEFKNKMQSYYEYYVPIEKDQTIKIEEKN
jgi:5'-nucleotidase